MADLHLAVDVEQLISLYLRSRSEVTALVGESVYTAIPVKKDFPLVAIHRPPLGSSISGVLHLVHSVLDIDVYGGSKRFANRTAETIRAVLDAPEFLGVHRDENSDRIGVVTGIDFGPFGWLPDSDFTPPQPRYQFSIDLYTHP